MRAAFEQRLLALSNAHTILTRTNWESANLRVIAEHALVPFAVDGRASRFEIHGDDLALAPQPALALAMAMHELASNAVKYGALSTEPGRVGLTWYTADEWLHLTWREMGGPPVAPPARRGFGSRLLERGLASELRGDVSLDYPADGVVCTIRVPIGQNKEAEIANG